MVDSKQFAVIKDGSKQHRVSVGDTVLVDRREGNPGDEITLGNVLCVGSSGQALKFGTPLLADVSVTGRIVGQPLGKKVIIFKKRRRKGYTKKQGHRQQYTSVKIDAIG